jgi:hypothetical protein
VVRILYVLSSVFLATAALTDVLIVPQRSGSFISIRGGELFWLYVAYFLVAAAVVFNNLQRARRRCLTRSSARRMSYLQLTILTPALGVFPFSALLPASEAFSVSLLLLVNLANVVVVVMLIFLSYPLSFFGSDIPDKTVKMELLRFLLRGPGTGLLALATIILTIDASRILGLPGEDFMPFAVVAVVLLWQWSIALILPRLERLLVYNQAEDESILHLQRLSERLLTRNDLLQHLEASLSALCDLLRAPMALVVTLRRDARKDTLEIIHSVGPVSLALERLQADWQTLQTALLEQHNGTAAPVFVTWETYQVTALYNHRLSPDSGPLSLLIVETTPNRLNRDEEEFAMLTGIIRRAALTVDDLALQQDIFASLEGLLPQIAASRRDDDLEYRQSAASRPVVHLPDKDELYEQVHAALRDYWGGPGITHSRLLDLRIAQAALNETGSPAKALRHMLQQAVSAHRPPGERNFTSPEWTLYNIIDLRFIEGKKVSEVARRMSLSEGDLYRKQRRAIEAMTDTLLTLEAQAQYTLPRP